MLAAACLIGALGCDGGGRVGRLSFEVAALSEEGCTAASETVATLNENAPCSVLRLYRREPGGDLTPVRLLRPGEDHAGQGSLELRFQDRNVSFDAMLDDDEAHDLFVTVYTGRPWAPQYGAHVENVRLDQEEIRVRLYPFRAWACPGRAADEDGQPEPRALHAAVTVGNGDVLLLGGVTGTRIDPAGANRAGRVGALLQPIPEVYDPVSQRFRRLTMVGGATGFARALFGAVYLGQDGDGRHRVRAIGGLELPEGNAGAAVLAFDNSGILTPLGAPFVPTEGAAAAAVVDLLYDAQAGTLEIVSPTPDPLGVRGAAVTVSAQAADDTRMMLIGLTGTGAGQFPSSNYYELPRTGAYSSHALLHQRLGATIDPVAALDGFLVWGGNVDNMTPRVLSNAGEILRGEGGATAIASDVALLPRPTAFHSSTPLGDDGVLIVGGVSIADGGNLLASPAADPIFALRASGTDTVVLEDALDGDYRPTILHTATAVPGWGVVVIGGAEVAADRLTPVARVGRVRRGSAGTLEFDGELQDLARPRFGHVATLLPGNRLLVTGGLERITRAGEEGLAALSLAEVIYLATEPYSMIDDGTCNDQSTLPDGGVDASMPPPDGGPVPDGGPSPDGGPVPDAGVPPAP